MSELQKVDLIMEVHSLRGIVAHVTKNKKRLSPYSALTPKELRPLLRNVLSYKNIHLELETVLNKCHKNLNIFIKLKGTLHKCAWRPSVTLNPTMSMKTVNDHVSYEAKLSDKDVILLADYFCFFPHNNIFTKASVRKLQSVNQLPWHIFSQFSLPKIPDNVDMIESKEFNQYPFYIKDLESFNDVSFYQNDQKINLKKINAEKVLTINYDSESSVISIAWSALINERKISYTNHFFHLITDKFEFKQYKVKQKIAIIKWVLRLLNGTRINADRYFDHFLPKLIGERDAKKLKQLLQLNYESVAQLIVSDQQWFLINMDIKQELILAFILTSLFEFDYIDSSMVAIQKEQFNYFYSYFDQIEAAVRKKIEFNNMKLSTIKNSLEIDISKLDHDTIEPEIYFNSELTSIEKITQYKNNLWSSIVDQHVEVMDHKVIQQCKQLLSVHQLQQSRKISQIESAQLTKMHLFDWITLRQSGVHVKMNDEQELLIKSFLSFKSLESIRLPKAMNSKSRSYQREGVNWMHFLYKHQLGGVLADDMGLGKTFQSILLLATLKEASSKTQTHKPHLIVVPSSLIFNWVEEFERFYPNLTTCAYIGMNRQLDKTKDVIVTSYELLRRDINDFEKQTYDLLIFDEAQFLKNANSARAQVVKQIKRHACFCLTGTPLENHIGEYIALLNIVLPGFINTDTKQGTLYQDKAMMDFLIKRTKPFVLRRLKSQINHELQKKTEDSIVLGMSPEQEKVYNGIITAAKQQMEKDQKNPKIKLLMLTFLLRLRQVCISPYLIDESFKEITPKFSFLKEKLSILKDEGHSALVFTQFMKSLDLLESLCKENNITYFRIDGTIPAIKRNKVIKSFQQCKQPAVLIMSLKASGFGLNLVKASYVFHIDPWWNPAVENQATDRVHRIGQQRPVFAYKLMMHNSIEQKIEEIKKRKDKLFRDLLDDSVISNRESALTVDDFKSLIETN